MRHELKYYVVKEELTRCLAIVMQHPASFKEAYPERQVNNIYLDSPELLSFQESQAGISNRTKYRIRWYGSWDKILEPVLECKSKQNHLGAKHHVGLDDFGMNELDLQLRLLQNRNLIPFQAGVVSTNHYLRSYYKSFCGRYRITIDKNLCFGQPLMGYVRPNFESKYIVLELKYEKEDEEGADWIRQFIPLRRRKFSKYIESF